MAGTVKPDKTYQDGGDTFLANHRLRIMYVVAIAVVLLLTPFAIYVMFEGRYLIGAALLVVVLGFAGNGVAIHLGRTPPIPFALLLIPIGASLALSLAFRGTYGVMWAYPTVMLFYFMQPRRIATLAGLLVLVVGSGIVYTNTDLAYAGRFAASLALTIIIVYVIIGVLQNLQQELLGQIVTDPLTGAFNRRHMDSVLGDGVERHRRIGAPASLLLVDIDHFKLINDRHGHNVGDKVLKNLVALIKMRSRKLDRLFRMGGEEFLVFLPDTSMTASIISAEHLRSAVAAASLADGVTATVSIGVAEYQAGETQESWIKRADDALYRAKESGRNRVICDESRPVTPLAVAPEPRARER